MSFFRATSTSCGSRCAKAERALEHDGVPIGAVVVFGGEVIEIKLATSASFAATPAHAEDPRAARGLGNGRLAAARRGTVLYVTLEPCAMCAKGDRPRPCAPGGLGDADHKAGAAGSVMNVLAEPKLNHRPDAAEHCSPKRQRS